MTVEPVRTRLRVAVTGTVSDAHTWNLIYLQLFLEELGHHVDNLGCCTPAEEVADHCREHRPDLVVFSTVNGHGYSDGLLAIRLLREVAPTVPAVIGGKLGITGGADRHLREALLGAGFTAVFEDNASPLALKDFVRELELCGAS
ncbi:cobalamin B12-binding domain-containing protein [Umezawaea sp. NPDC059074]|uniref:cobalamin B12-binding domain-containing protein n=1 Tax=Umezawaea sp. NPDC059074 TaxID=3346716 RepID=UPI00367ACA6F